MASWQTETYNATLGPALDGVVRAYAVALIAIASSLVARMPARALSRARARTLLG